VLALVGSDVERAKKLCSEDWFLDELASYRSCGTPIWDGNANLTLRRANEREAMEIEIALHNEQARNEFEGYLFVFLVPTDPLLQ
jgi:hypothetical protein